MVFVEVRCADSIPWLGRLTALPGDFLEAHGISDLWLFLALSLTAAELILRFGNPKRPRLAAVAAG